MANQPEQIIAIRGEYITLGQLLQLADIISSGGQARPYLEDNPVRVNGEPEQRRGRKLRPGDLVQAANALPIRIAASGEAGT